MDRNENPIDRLINKFNRAGKFEVTSVTGFVEEIGVLEEGDRKIYLVHISNGPERNSFWVAPRGDEKTFYPPRVGERVSGIVNTLDDRVQYADLSYKPIFDFTHHTALAEESHFAWFRRQAQLIEDYKQGTDSPDLSPLYRDQLKRQP